jgi:hypothetical protein
MKDKITILIICMLLIGFVIPASGIIVSNDKTIVLYDPETYRTKVKHLDDGRDAPLPGDLSDEFVFREIINDLQLTSQPSERPIGFKSETIIDILNQIDEALILGYLENLTDFGPRVTGTQECADSGDYIYDIFEDLGLETRYHEWSNGGYSDRNIEGTLEGSLEASDEIYIICAHYDTVSGSPGADDDGSGTVAVMTAAYVMSQYQFNHTIKFVTFSGEEQGLLGSEVYAQEAAANGDNIVAVLNADMIGFAISEDDGNNIKIYENTASEWITDFSITIAQDYNEYIDLTLIPSGTSYGSDHYSFWQFGYNSIFYHEYNFNDYYHSPQDTIENMNMTYDTKSTRLMIATLGELAQAFLIGDPPETPSSPEGPSEGTEGEELTFLTSTTDPDEDQLYYQFDWGDNNYSLWLGPYDSGETIEATNVWQDLGVYEVRVKAKDINKRVSDWSESVEVTINKNLAPSIPTIDGPKIGVTGKPLTFTFSASDPDDHDIYYYIIWGDGTHDNLFGPYTSGDEITLEHQFVKGGIMYMNVKARDIYGKEGETENYQLFILKSRAASNQFLLRSIERFIESFPRLEFIFNGFFN